MLACYREMVMDETAAFLEEVLPRMHEADTALHNGDAQRRIEMWSQLKPLTLFGAARTDSSWEEIRSAFEWVASTFSRCESFAIEVIAADATDNLGYIAAIERTRVSVGGAPPADYALRVTTVFRRESGTWKVVHRHADPQDDSAGAIERLRGLAREA
jgi:ketosteroid isomerase-like protein